LELVVELVELLVGELYRLLHVRAEERDRVALHVLLELRLRAVRALTASDIEWPMKR
jgi:hypothetical protein